MKKLIFSLGVIFIMALSGCSQYDDSAVVTPLKDGIVFVD